MEGGDGANSLDQRICIQAVAMCIAECASRDFACESPTLASIDTHTCGERTLAATNLDESFTLELLIRLAHRIRIDAKLTCELPYRWQGITRAQSTDDERTANFVHDLEVEGPRVPWINTDQHTDGDMVY